MGAQRSDQHASARYGALGRYQLLWRIAYGGMAELFAARMSGAGGSEKIVAIKRILPELAHDRQFVDMFLDEARIAATLSHPNVVDVYGIESVDDHIFISMEYLRGRDLGAIMKSLRREQRRMPLPLALRVISDIADGLHHAHEKRDAHGQPLGIIHRDVSPRNVVITDDGRVKLVDFGIAKARDRLSITKTGTVKGKFPYMAPEQILEQPVDRRADVFSLGVLLWELTCGQRLYTGVTDYEVLKKILHTPVPRPSEVVPDYPPGLEAIVLGALAREPAARYPTAAALQTVLGKVARQLENAASSARLAEVVRDLSAGEAQVPSPPPAAREDFAVVVDSGDRGTLELDDLVELHDLVEPDEEQAPEATPVRPTGRGWTRLIVLLVLAGAVAATFYLRPELGHEAVDLLRRLRTALASW